MPFSAFARCGNGFRCSSKKPLARALYDSFKYSNGSGEAFAEGGPIAARWFANSMAIGRARQSLERAKNQAEPLRCFDLLKAHERHYGIAVPPGATLQSRRAVLDAAYKVGLGPVRANIEYQLRAALGADFVAWVTTVASVAPTYFPVTPWDLSKSAPTGIFGIPPVWTRVRIQSSIAILGSRTVLYDTVGGDNVSIAPGDLLVIDPTRCGLVELVQVTAATTSPYAFTAVFTKAHEDETDALIWPFPYWMNRSLHSLVVVPNGRAMVKEVRRAANEVMRKLMGGVSTWDVVEESTTPGEFIGFVPGVGAPGITPIEALTF